MTEERLNLTELIAEARASIDPSARNQAYWFSVDFTGVAAVDAILSALAVAGKGAHSTEFWDDDDNFGYYSSARPGLVPGNDSAIGLIQANASRAAELIARLADALEREMGR